METLKVELNPLLVLQLGSTLLYIVYFIVNVLCSKKKKSKELKELKKEEHNMSCPWRIL
jgi:hypothetical protein